MTPALRHIAPTGRIGCSGCAQITIPHYVVWSCPKEVPPRHDEGACDGGSAARMAACKAGQCPWHPSMREAA